MVIGNWSTEHSGIIKTDRRYIREKPNTQKSLVTAIKRHVSVVITRHWPPEVDVSKKVEGME